MKAETFSVEGTDACQIGGGGERKRSRKRKGRKRKRIKHVTSIRTSACDYTTTL